MILSQEQKEKLKNDYNSLSQKDLKTKYSISHKYLQRILKSFGIENVYRMMDRPRKYSQDDCFFDEINTEEKAYFLGFLLADGYVSAKKENWMLALRVIDLDVVEKLKKALKSTFNIQTMYSDKRKTCYEIRISSKYMVDSLKKLNLIQNKTKRVTISELIPQELWHHVIRGYFDGDGCIYVKKNRENYVTCSISSCSLEILKQIESFLKNEKVLTFPEKKYIYKYDNKNYGTIVVNSRKETNNFLKFLYKNSSVYMDRKYLKAKLVTNNFI